MKDFIKSFVGLLVFVPVGVALAFEAATKDDERETKLEYNKSSSGDFPQFKSQYEERGDIKFYRAGKAFVYTSIGVCTSPIVAPLSILYYAKKRIFG